MEYRLKSQSSACRAYDGLTATQPHHCLTTTLLGQLFRTIPKLTEHSKLPACCIALLVADSGFLHFIREGCELDGAVAQPGFLKACAQNRPQHHNGRIVVLH